MCVYIYNVTSILFFVATPYTNYNLIAFPGNLTSWIFLDCGFLIPLETEREKKRYWSHGFPNLVSRLESGRLGLPGRKCHL